MDRTSTEVVSNVNPEIAAIEELLADEIVEESEIEEPTDEATEIADAETVNEEDLEEAVNAADGEELKQQAYEDQEATSDVVEVSEDGVKRGSKNAKKAKEPKAPRPSFSTKSEALVHRIGGVDQIVLEVADADLDETALSAKRAEFLAAVDNAAKKVQEKVVNAMAAATKGVKLSEYTAIALKVLFAAEGAVPSKTIYEEMRKRYSEGTSRSQSQQMMQLLPLLRIANRSKEGLTLNENSVLAAVFKEALSK